MGGKIISEAASIPQIDMPLMTVSEVAQYLAVSKSMIYKLVEERQIVYIRIGKSLRFKKEDIERWIESHRVDKALPTQESAQFISDIDKLLRTPKIGSEV